MQLTAVVLLGATSAVSNQWPITEPDRRHQNRHLSTCMQSTYTIKEVRKGGTALKMRARYLLWIATIAATPIAALAQQDSTAQQTILNKYCITCHNEKLRTGGLSLQNSDLSRLPAAAETWEKVVRKLRTGAMPPQGVPRPDAAAVND